MKNKARDNKNNKICSATFFCLFAADKKGASSAKALSHTKKTKKNTRTAVVLLSYKTHIRSKLTHLFPKKNYNHSRFSVLLHELFPRVRLRTLPSCPPPSPPLTTKRHFHTIYGRCLTKKTKREIRLKKHWHSVAATAVQHTTMPIIIWTK